MAGIVSLALKFDGAGASFVEEGGKSVAAFGGATQVADSAASGGVAASFAAGAYLEIPASADFEFPGAFCIGGWITPANIGAWRSVLGFLSNEDYGPYIGITHNSSGYLCLNIRSETHYFSNDPLAVGRRDHFLVSRDGANTLRLFLNGVKNTEVPSFGGTVGLANKPLRVARDYFNQQYLGLIDDLFIIKDDPVFVANFTPPTEIPMPLVPYGLTAGLAVVVAPGAAMTTLAAPLQVVAGSVSAATAGLLVNAGRMQVFDVAGASVRWRVVATVGGVDVSDQLAGAVQIEAAEDSARLAHLVVRPLSPAQLAGFDSAPVTIDIALTRGSDSGTVRRFTGVVEVVEFSPVDRLATLTCRDGWQERALACANADAVHALLAGRAAPCAKIVGWDAARPDPAGYFRSLLATLPGATFIDAAGVWRVVDWSLSSPVAALTAGDIFDGSLKVRRPARADVPRAVTATLTHRFARLHNMQVALSWSAVDRTDYVERGLPPLPKSVIMDALSRANGWLVKGEVSIVPPVPGAYPVNTAGGQVYYSVSYQDSLVFANAMSATMYRRWYQQAEVSYSVSIDMGGASDRDDAVSAAIESRFDGNAWETPRPSTSSLGIWQANPPGTDPDAVPPTGYEALSGPWPPGNGALDWHSDIDAATLQQAAQHVVALAVRRAAAGRRQQRVSFERPIDPRREIGDVLDVSAYGVTARGQVMSFVDTLDHDSGECTTQITLACPEGNGLSIGSTASVTPPAPGVAHNGAPVLLGNHIGADTVTARGPNTAPLVGFLCNTLPTSDHYDASAPVYETQFRVILPEIAAAVRDPLKISAPLAATVNLPSGGLTINF